MNSEKRILIAGAGPSGLSLAIFLSELGFYPTIIDKKESISTYSKALASKFVRKRLQLFKPVFPLVMPRA